MSATTTSEIRVTLIGSDENDVHCDICNRRDWYQALQFTRYDDGQAQRRVMCLRRYEGESCGELAKDALFETKIPAGTFAPRVVI